MKASLFAEDDDESDMFHNQGATKASTDLSSPRLVLPGAHRPSGMKQRPHRMLVTPVC